MALESRRAWSRGVAVRVRAVRRFGVVLTVACALSTGCTVADQDFGTRPTSVNAAAVPASLAGTWTGTYRVIQCAQHDGGPLANMCTSLGASFPFTLELQQNGQVVTGRYALANMWFDLSPSQISDDRATLRGTGRIDTAGVTVDVTWSLSVAPPALGGTAVLEWVADAGGSATLHANIVGKAAQP